MPASRPTNDAADAVRWRCRIGSGAAERGGSPTNLVNAGDSSPNPVEISSRDPIESGFRAIDPADPTATAFRIAACRFEFHEDRASRRHASAGTEHAAIPGRIQSDSARDRPRPPNSARISHGHPNIDPLRWLLRAIPEFTSRIHGADRHDDGPQNSEDASGELHGSVYVRCRRRLALEG